MKVRRRAASEETPAAASIAAPETHHCGYPLNGSRHCRPNDRDALHGLWDEHRGKGLARRAIELDACI
eukprot:scaffold160839_cov36-Tisochrysis_lutea.AAC.7